MVTQPSWYETGYEGAEKEQEKKNLGYPPDRWWMRAGETKEMVFIDDTPFCIREHSWRDSNGRWHHETCIAKIADGGCPADGATGVQRADYTGHYTIVDITGYVSKDNTEHKHRLVLLPAKTKVLNKFKLKKENRGSLLGQLWTLSRSDKNAPNTGDDLDHVREIKMDGLYGVVTYKGKKIKDLIDKANGTGTDAARTRKYLAHHFQIPEEGPIPEKIPTFNYAVQFAPKDPATLKELIADAKPFKGGDDSSSGSSVDDDVPF
jgi:hypothetical protein